ncbi:MAG: DNA polymerase III subunit delta' [Vicinamibacterales bacterium]
MPFRHIVGHRRLVALLSRSIARDTLPPSLILSGPAGVGKRLAALSIAQALNCRTPIRSADAESPEQCDACGECPACTRIARGVHPDVVFLEPNDKGNIKIDSVRDVIERSGYRPFEGRRRVTIVDQADALERSAQNAFLKVLEEPPSGSVFLLVTASPDLLLQTVRSRCPQLRFQPLAEAEVAAYLMAQGTSEAEARSVAAEADGSIGRALDASADALVDARDVALRVLAQAAATDDTRRRIECARDLVVKAGAASTERDQLAAYLRAMSTLLRDVAAVATTADRSLLANPDLVPALERLNAYAGDRGRQAFVAIDKALAALDRYTNAKLVADWLVLQL